MQVLQQCKDRGVSHEVAIEMMEVLWSHRCTPPWAPGEIAQHFKNLRRDKPIGVKLKSQTPAAGQLVVSPNTPVKTARKIVEAEFTRDGVRTMQHYQGEFLIWDGKRHRAVREDTIESVIYKSLDVAQRRTMAGLISFDPKRAHVGEVLKALTSESQLSELIDAPAWIVPGDRPPADELFPCGNGLLHLPTGCLLAPTPEFFALAASDVIFDPNAPPPELWFKFLNQLFGTDKQARQLLQEWMGYLLSMDTSLQKMFFVIGPRRSGKGTVGRIIKMLLGKDSVASPSMSSLAKEFGLQPLIAATLAIVSDVRIGAKTDKASLMENVLKISGEDAPEVPRKFIGPWKGTLRTRFMFLANELPGLDDSSAALAGRMMVLKLTESFYGKEDPGLTGKLQAELSGILNWAIEGYRSLRKRAFTHPLARSDYL
jgi:putative DNA primase/helicase